ncbi:MAG: glycoside hydrolase family 2 TIM barrel-domain containing protein [Candidatus Firestonebacteria bacterium]
MKGTSNRILNDIFIVSDFDKSGINTTFTAPFGCTGCKWEVLDQGRAVTKGSLSIKTDKNVKFKASLPNFKSWHTYSPYLYTLKLELVINGKTVEVEEVFGMRKIHVSAGSIYVNNEPFYVRGYIRGRKGHEHPNLENLSLTEFYEKSIRAAKEYGFNFIRFHSTIPPDECFEVADRLGVFIHIEPRPYYGKYQLERSMLDDKGTLVGDEVWRNMFLRLRNHPSLMAYCVGNEIRHPGTNPRVRELAKIAKEMDPTRLFIDTCAHGELDRDYVDFDVQHMSYYYPFGSTADMFENTQNWLIYGSCTGLPLIEKDKENDFTYRIKRSIASKRPVIAHEICHYIALRDLEALEEKLLRFKVKKPWWVEELKKLVKLKGLEKDYGKMMAASKYFQFLSWKLGIEAARRSSLLCGFHFLQLSDSDDYENSNGLLDIFDDPTGVDTKKFLKFNADCVLLADIPRRTYLEKEKVTIPVILSHFSPEIGGKANFHFKLQSKKGKAVSITAGLKEISMDQLGRREICLVEINLPEVKKPEALAISFHLSAGDGSYTLENSWDIWLYPNRPQKLPASKCTVVLDDINLALRYPQITGKGSLKKPEKLLITNRFTSWVFKHLAEGGDVLMLYRVPETRNRMAPAEKEKYYLPATWDRFKGVIWDRGTNCGAFMRNSKALEGFPNTGYLDLQFHGIVDDCDKISLDGFPVKIDPIIQGVDKAARDRFDVFTFKLSELQPEWTMRKFAYLFELRVGKGRLLVSGFNFTGLNKGVPETCALFESLMNYVNSGDFKPEAGLGVKELEAYLMEKGKAPRILERMMTQYWQLNNEPLETAQYWKDAEEYIKNGGKINR